MILDIICVFLFLFLFGNSISNAVMDIKKEKYKIFAIDVTFALFFATEFMYFFVRSMTK
jgi:hypothetical protein